MITGNANVPGIYVSFNKIRNETHTWAGDSRKDGMARIAQHKGKPFYGRFLLIEEPDPVVRAAAESLLIDALATTRGVVTWNVNRRKMPPGIVRDQLQKAMKIVHKAATYIATTARSKKK